MNSEQLKSFLQRYQLTPNFTYGQNFLIDDLVLEDMADAAAVGPGDAVLEIGPGIGNLTRVLCGRAAYVLSVEKDPSFLPVLTAIKKDFPKNFRFETEDILKFDFQEAFRQAGYSSYKVVANIPYYVTGKILQMLLSASMKPSSITVLMQKEVAKNVAARPGSLSILGISVQLYGEPKLIQIVPARSFYPSPKVDSAVIQIAVFSEPRVPIADEKKFFSLVRACFAGKRKQLHNSLSNFLKGSKEQAAAILAEAGIAPETRPQELTLEQWSELNKAVWRREARIKNNEL